MKRRLMISVVRMITATGADEASSCAEATIEAPAKTSMDISMATSGGMPLATIATPVMTPKGMMPRRRGSVARAPATKATLLLAAVTAHLLAHAGALLVAGLALARRVRLVALGHPFLGLRLALRRILALRAQLRAHALAARFALLAFARLARLAVRLAALGEALLAGFRVLALCADLALHAAAPLGAFLALAGFARLLAQLLPLRLAFFVGGLGVQAEAGRQQRGADDCRNSHETFSFGEIPSPQRFGAHPGRHAFVTLYVSQA